jgi:hypothetical protein
MPGFSINGGGSGISPDNKAEFNRNHRWRIEKFGLPDGALAGNAGGARNLKLYAKSIQLPSLTFEEEKIKGANSYYKIAKRAEWQDVTVKFYDVYGLHKLFRAWQDEIWTEDDGIKGPSNYKGEPQFLLLGGTGSINQFFTLHGAYPKKVDHGDLSYDNSDIKLITVTYSYDFATITAGPNG